MWTLFNWLKKTKVTNSTLHKGESKAIKNQKLIKNFIRVEDNPYMVSFPRSGSHWVRMLIELYFERPTLTRNFYFPNSTDYILLGTHDLDSQTKRKNVLYMYRNPTDTIFSQLKYHKESTTDKGRIDYWLDAYIKNLRKWLIEENFTSKKTIIKYEKMKNDFNDEFTKVIHHFGGEVDLEKIDEVRKSVTKEEVHLKVSKQDKQVIPVGIDYSQLRIDFNKQYEGYLNKRLQQAGLDSFFV